MRGTSVSFEFLHIDFKNLIERNNVARTTADYTQVNVASPIDGSTIPFYNVSAAKGSAVSNVDSNDPNLQRWYNSFEISLNARLPHGVRISGGPPIDRVITTSSTGTGHGLERCRLC